MDKFNKDVENFISSYVEALRGNYAAVFIGSGVSVPQGFPSWEKLLEPLVREMGLDINKGYDLSVLAQYYVDTNGGNRGEINQMLLQRFKKKGQRTSLTHQLLARLPIFTYWTTNYDTLMEQALEESMKVPDVKKCVENLPIVRMGRDAVVYKMHGDVDFPHDAVLTKHDYEDYSLKRAPFRDQFKSDFLGKTFLFVGFGFRDPNLDFLVGQIRTLMHRHLHRNYYFIKNIPESVSAEKYHEMRLQMEQLKQYGLYPVPVDAYEEIPKILKKIEYKFRKSYIFISGSAETYGSWLSSNAARFISTLSYRLSEKQYKIVSGFGANVGQSVVNGALQYMQANHIQPLWHNHLLLLPVPVENGSSESQKKEKFIAESGICIILFGNRLNENGEVITDDNIKDEFYLARNKELDVIPVGATGYAAHELWKEVYERFDTYYPSAPPELKELFAQLDVSPMKEFKNELDNGIRFLHQECNFEPLLEVILKIVDLLNQ